MTKGGGKGFEPKWRKKIDGGYRIRFVVDTTTFHIDEVAWDRMKLVKEENKKRWMKILAIDSDSGTVKIAF